MTDNINPSHYKDGPFECIELSITHNVPFFAACRKRNADILEAQAIRLLGILQAENWADLEPFWDEIKWGCYKKAVKVLADKINEIEKDGE